MKRLEEIMVEYAREKGGGLPLTPQEMCNAVVLWVQEKLLGEVKETYPSFEGDKGVDVEHNEVDNHYVFSLDTEYVQSLIPEITAEKLLSLFEGSETIVVDLNEDGSKIEFHLDGEVVNKLSRALLIPVQSPSEVQLVAIGTDGSQVNIPISEVAGGNRLYRHKIDIEGTYDLSPNIDNYSFTLLISFISANSAPVTSIEDIEFYGGLVGVFNSADDGSQGVFCHYNSDGRSFVVMGGKSFEFAIEFINDPDEDVDNIRIDHMYDTVTEL